MPTYLLLRVTEEGAALLCRHNHCVLQADSLAGVANRLDEMHHVMPDDGEVAEVARQLYSKKADFSEHFGPLPMVGSVGSYQMAKMVRAIQDDLMKLACPGGTDVFNSPSSYGAAFTSSSNYVTALGFGSAMPCPGVESSDPDECEPVVRGPV